MGSPVHCVNINRQAFGPSAGCRRSQDDIRWVVIFNSMYCRVAEHLTAEA